MTGVVMYRLVDREGQPVSEIGMRTDFYGTWMEAQEAAQELCIDYGPLRVESWVARAEASDR